MKLLTLNTHALQEENYLQKLDWFVEGILQEKPDIIALQEVNQSCDGELAEKGLWEGQFLLPARVPLRQDNHAAQVAYRLRQRGIDCHWAWFPIKLGYGKFEEGISLLSLGRKILEKDLCYISRTQDHHNWRTRAVLGIRVEGMSDWFYSAHTGWWEDGQDPFQEQWERLEDHLLEKRKKERLWLMGDFNAPDTVLGESYTHVLSKGWMDTYNMAQKKDNGITVCGTIDGWRDKEPTGMRLDYIFCNQEADVESSQVIFNDRNRPVVSDHFGVMIQTKEK